MSQFARVRFYRSAGVLYAMKSSYDAIRNTVYGRCYPSVPDQTTYRELCAFMAKIHTPFVSKKLRPKLEVALSSDEGLEAVLEKVERSIIERRISSDQIGALDIAKMTEEQFNLFYWHEAKY